MRDRGALQLAAAAWLATAVLYVVSEGLTAAAFVPDYSYASNYISDLGAPTCGAVFDGRAVCSPRHALMNAAFVVQGGLFVLAALAAARALSTPARFVLVLYAVAMGLGLWLIALFPESAAGAAPLHALGALLAIVFGNATAFVSAFAFAELGLARIHLWTSLALPVFAAAALSALVVALGRGAAVGLPDGAWERISVYTIVAWEISSAVVLVARLRGTSDRPSDERDGDGLFAIDPQPASPEERA